MTADTGDIDTMTETVQMLLEPTVVSLNYTARDATDVVTHLGNLLRAAGYVRDTFIAAALAREAEMPTGLPLAGNVNAAIPHTDIEHVIKPGLAMATLSEPVDFHNMVAPEECVPVRLVFLLALDRPKAQIEMLQALAGILQNPDLVARLMSASDIEDVRTALIEA